MKSPKIENAKRKSPKILKTPKVDDHHHHLFLFSLSTAELEDVASDLKKSNNAVLLLYVIRQLLLLLAVACGCVRTNALHRKRQNEITKTF